MKQLIAKLNLRELTIAYGMSMFYAILCTLLKYIQVLGHVSHSGD